MSYNISKADDGGFYVRRGGSPDGWSPTVFACTDIGEALNYVRDKLSDAAPKSPPNFGGVKLNWVP